MATVSRSKYPFSAPPENIFYSLRSKMIASLRLRNPLQDGRESRCNIRDYRPLYFYPRIHNEAFILEWREYIKATSDTD